jgi:hypothetical protein
MNEYIFTITTNPRHKIVAMVENLKIFPTYGNSLLINKSIADLFTITLTKSIADSVNQTELEETTR